MCRCDANVVCYMLPRPEGLAATTGERINLQVSTWWLKQRGTQHFNSPWHTCHPRFVHCAPSIFQADLAHPSLAQHPLSPTSIPPEVSQTLSTSHCRVNNTGLSFTRCLHVTGTAQRGLCCQSRQPRSHTQIRNASTPTPSVATIYNA